MREHSAVRIAAILTALFIASNRLAARLLPFCRNGRRRRCRRRGGPGRAVRFTKCGGLRCGGEPLHRGHRQPHDPEDDSRGCGHDVCRARRSAGQRRRSRERRAIQPALWRRCGQFGQRLCCRHEQQHDPEDRGGHGDRDDARGAGRKQWKRGSEGPHASTSLAVWQRTAQAMSSLPTT